jgi:calcineurin-like phosphoesterase family protein
MSLWFTSDTHFNHSQVIERQNRPFTSLTHMHEEMIDRWNTLVDPHDTVYVLGDFAYEIRSPDGWEMLRLFRALNGTKHLVIGNHDEAHREVLRLPWESQSYMIGIQTRRQSHRWLTASHYAMETWRGMSRGSLMLHGHSHGTLKRQIPYRFDVGVDVWGYAPVNIDTLVDIAKKQTFVAQDMHGEYDYKAFE